MEHLNHHYEVVGIVVSFFAVSRESFHPEFDYINDIFRFFNPFELYCTLSFYCGLLYFISSSGSSMFLSQVSFVMQSKNKPGTFH